MKKQWKVLSLLAVFIFLYAGAVFAGDQIEGFWYNQEKTGKVHIFKGKDNKYYGKLVWVRDPGKKDVNNPDAAQRNNPLMGTEILKGFVKDGDKKYVNGTIYDPNNGKTYSCKMTFKGSSLDIRGYIGMSLFGRTTTWSRTN